MVMYSIAIGERACNLLGGNLMEDGSRLIGASKISRLVLDKQAKLLLSWIWRVWDALGLERVSEGPSSIGLGDDRWHVGALQRCIPMFGALKCLDHLPY